MLWLIGMIAAVLAVCRRIAQFGEFMKFGKIFAAAAGLSISLGIAPAAFAFGPDSYTGDVGLIAATFCPSGSFEAAGQELSIPQYNVLFSLIGTTHGGDGQRTFKLPDLRGNAPEDMRFCIVYSGIYPTRP